jgi:hypothetical protein
MKSKTLLMMSSAIAVLASIGLFISVSYAQENMTSAANETGAIMENQRNQTGEALGGTFGGGGNQSQ